jgi:hypothetical protein
VSVKRDGQDLTVNKKHVQANHHAQIQSKGHAMMILIIHHVNALRPGQENLAQKRHVLEKILKDILILVLVMEYVEMIMFVAALMPTKEMIVVKLKVQQTPLQKYQLSLLLQTLKKVL